MNITCKIVERLIRMGQKVLVQFDSQGILFLLIILIWPMTKCLQVYGPTIKMSSRTITFVFHNYKNLLSYSDETLHLRKFDNIMLRISCHIESEHLQGQADGWKFWHWMNIYKLTFHSIGFGSTSLSTRSGRGRL